MSSNTSQPLLRRAPRRLFTGLTLIEVLIAMSLFLVGIVGILAAFPAGIDSALFVVLQDAAIHLAHSKFAEFRRDRIDPAIDLLLDGSNGYLPSGGSYTKGKQEPCNASGKPWRDFASAPGQPYEFFDDISRYEWSVETSAVAATTSSDPPPPAGFVFPDQSGNPGMTPLNLTRVTIHVRMKNTKREFTFTQYMAAYDPKLKP